MLEDVAAQMEPMFIVWVALLGACVGSFLNVCIFRMPRECMTVFRPKRSFCPRCGRKLSWSDNIPILAWILLRARCAGCKTSISPRYPLVETFTMLVFGWLAYRILPGNVPSPEAWGVLLIHTSFASALIVCAGTDLDYRIIPDEITLPGLVLAPLAIALVPSALPHGAPDLAGTVRWVHGLLDSPLHWWGLGGLSDSLGGWAEPDGAFSPLLSGLVGSLLGAGLGAAFMQAVGITFGKLLGREAMGFGDVKMLAMVGAVAGWQGLLVTLVVALTAGSGLGLVYMAATGRPQPTGADLGAEAPPARRFVLRLIGARPGPAVDQPISTWPGTSLVVRLATGESSIPFGPFLALGAAVAVFVPNSLEWVR